MCSPGTLPNCWNAWPHVCPVRRPSPCCSPVTRALARRPPCSTWPACCVSLCMWPTSARNRSSATSSAGAFFSFAKDQLSDSPPPSMGFYRRNKFFVLIKKMSFFLLQKNFKFIFKHQQMFSLSQIVIEWLYPFSICDFSSPSPHFDILIELVFPCHFKCMVNLFVKMF